MTPERWKQISQLYDAALRRAGSERMAFLTDACDGDASLQREVQALLDQPTSPKGLEDLTPAAIAQAMGETTGVSMTGRRFGVYLVQERIGGGGMGEVYRARDTSLGRDVAIKVLPQAFATDADRLARFEREARILASLDHPHIGTIHGIENSDGIRALVLALVEGETLADRIVRGSISMTEALEYARQIADALEAAHDKGIVHRDLKPANIKITPAGVVKVLDFGLAKIDEASSSEALTRTANATGTGVVMGTLAYMSPEQARGHAVDKRADIWAFGCVLYEMLTGRGAFAGRTPSDTIAAILERDADLQALPATTPSGIERLLKRCFDKDHRRRLRDIGEARVEIDVAQRPPALQDGPGPTSRRWLVATLVSAVVVIAAAAVLVWTRVPVPPASAGSATRFFVGVTPADAFGPGPTRRSPIFPYPTRTDVALSPDGTLLVFSARKDGRQQLYLQHAQNRLESTPIAGTDNSNSPFFSPDGQWLGFWTGSVDAGALGELKKMRLDGSPATTLARVPPLRGATWGPNDIVFAVVEGEGRLWRVPAAGGRPETLTRLDSKDGNRRHSLPQMLPDGRAVLYTTSSPNYSDGQTVVMSLATGETHVVLDQGIDARYIPSGHLVYVHEGTLMAAPFDLQGLRLTGTPVVIVKSLMQTLRTGSISVGDTGAGQFSVSNNGVLVYVPGAPVPDLRRSLVWVSRNGTVTPTTLPPGPYGGARLSPDAKRVLLFGNQRILIHDLVRGGLMPVAPGGWFTLTPDGKQITVNEPSGFVSTSIEGGATDHVAVGASPSVHTAGSWSPDNQTLLFARLIADGAWEIRSVSRTGGDRKVHPAGNVPINERYPQFSPDGKWFVYSSNERGEEQIYVERFRGAAERYAISTNGGTAPVWAPNGREVFYATPAAEPEHMKMMAVAVTLSPAFKAGIPHVLFEGHYNPGTPHRNYDVSPDGRFLMFQEAQAPPPPPVTQMVLVLNWFEELKRLAPSDR